MLLFKTKNIKDSEKREKSKTSESKFANEELLKESIKIIHTTGAPWNRDQKHAKANALHLLTEETL
ncbi:MAG: hypothetical protein QW112_01715 [Candidatus Micrarchaeia archaeon]